MDKQKIKEAHMIARSIDEKAKVNIIRDTGFVRRAQRLVDDTVEVVS